MMYARAYTLGPYMYIMHINEIADMYTSKHVHVCICCRSSTQCLALLLLLLRGLPLLVVLLPPPPVHRIFFRLR